MEEPAIALGPNRVNPAAESEPGSCLSSAPLQRIPDVLGSSAGREDLLQRGLDTGDALLREALADLQRR